MSQDNRRSMVLQGEVLPAEHRGDLRMPAGTPLGMGILGAARFNAIRRVLEAYERARLAQSRLYDAEAEVANAFVRRELAQEQLRNLDVIRAGERQRIHSAYNRHVEEEEEAQTDAKIRRLRRQVELLEAEDALRAAEGQRRGRPQPELPKSAEPDGFAGIIRTIQSIPELAKATASARADIIREAGGEENLSEGQRDMINQLDTMAMTSVSKQGEGPIL